MDRFVAPLFWSSSFAAVFVAFLLPVGPWRWAAISWLGIVGVSFASVNWALVVRGVLGRGGGSPVPGLGGVLLGISVAAVPVDPLRWWAPAMLALDPWVPLMIFAVCVRRVTT